MGPGSLNTESLNNPSRALNPSLGPQSEEDPDTEEAEGHPNRPEPLFERANATEMFAWVDGVVCSNSWCKRPRAMLNSGSAQAF
jgi:hypothetical protein